MKLESSGSTIIFKNEDTSFEISKAIDEDIFFASRKPNITFTFNYRSSNVAEWKVAEIFTTLISKIIGNYFLEEHFRNYNNLPKDFINLKNKEITWHCDDGRDNILKIKYDDHNITISIIKDPNESEHSNNSVRIRTNGSKYGSYYHHFTDLYNELLVLAFELKPKVVPTQNTTKIEPQKKHKFNWLGLKK